MKDHTEEIEKVKKCPSSFILAINDTINVLNGKWKLSIISSLLFGGKRFKDLQGDIPRITPRMLSKELRDLEINGIVKRTVFDTIPVTIQYSLTESGQSFSRVLDVMLEWGLEHRRREIGQLHHEHTEAL